MNINQYNERRLENLKTQISNLLCDHPKVEIRYKLASNGVKMFKNQCVRCGRTDKNWIPHTDIENKDDIKPINDDLKDNYNKTVSELDQALSERIATIENFDHKTWYREYLLSPQWQHNRNLVFLRCGRICEGCFTNKATEVHHLTYKNVGNEFLFELVGLCTDCHKRIHPE